MTDWTPTCVLCASRGRQTRLEAGHCCAACATRIADDLAAIVDLAAMASAWLMPGSTGPAGSRSVPSSRPPLNVEALDPALASVPGHHAPLLVLLEEWCRLIRAERGLSPYGPASLEWAVNGPRSAVGESRAVSGGNDTSVTLVGCVAFLRAQVPWITAEPGFPLEDFAAEVREFVRVLRRWDTEAERINAYVVECPHETDAGTCGHRLRIAGDDAEGWFHCPRCRTEWSVDRLMLVWAETSDAAMWLDAEAVTRRYGVDRTTLDRWVRSGRMSKWHGLYDVRPLALAQRRVV